MYEKNLKIPNKVWHKQLVHRITDVYSEDYLFESGFRNNCKLCKLVKCYDSCIHYFNEPNECYIIRHTDKILTNSFLFKTYTEYLVQLYLFVNNHKQNPGIYKYVCLYIRLLIYIYIYICLFIFVTV